MNATDPEADLGATKSPGGRTLEIVAPPDVDAPPSDPQNGRRVFGDWCELSWVPPDGFEDLDPLGKALARARHHNRQRATRAEVARSLAESAAGCARELRARPEQDPEDLALADKLDDEAAGWYAVLARAEKADKVHANLNDDTLRRIRRAQRRERARWRP